MWKTCSVLQSGHTHPDGGHTHPGSGHTHPDSGHTHPDSGHTHPDSVLPTQTPIQWVPVISIREREAVHLHLSIAKAKNEWRCNFITPYAFMTCKDAALLATVRSCVRVPTRTVCVWLLSAVGSVWEHVQYADSWNMCNMGTVGTCAICGQLEHSSVQRNLLDDVTQSTSTPMRTINALCV